MCPAVGQRLRLGRDSLAVTSAGITHTYAISDVVRAEASRGLRSRRAWGVGIGGVAGMAATYLALNAGGSTAYCDQSANQDAIETRYCLGLFVLGGLAGAGLGYVVGGLITNERWEEVASESLRIGLRFGLRVAPEVGFRLAF